MFKKLLWSYFKSFKYFRSGSTYWEYILTGLKVLWLVKLMLMVEIVEIMRVEFFNNSNGGNSCGNTNLLAVV